MGIIKSIIEKFKLNELVAILLVTSFILTILPNNFIVKLGLQEIKQFQMYISLCLVICISYYVFIIINMILMFVKRRFLYGKRIGINYMKKYMSPDEMNLLVFTFYNKKDNFFNSSGYIEYADGRKTALERKKILYLASNMSCEVTMFAYNLQPYAREFLNSNLKKGNIKIEPNSITYKLR